MENACTTEFVCAILLGLALIAQHLVLVQIFARITEFVVEVFVIVVMVFMEMTAQFRLFLFLIQIQLQQLHVCHHVEFMVRA